MAALPEDYWSPPTDTYNPPGSVPDVGTYVWVLWSMFWTGRPFVKTTVRFVRPFLAQVTGKTTSPGGESVTGFTVVFPHSEDPSINYPCPVDPSRATDRVLHDGATAFRRRRQRAYSWQAAVPASSGSSSSSSSGSSGSSSIPEPSCAPPPPPPPPSSSGASASGKKRHHPSSTAAPVAKKSKKSKKKSKHIVSVDLTWGSGYRAHFTVYNTTPMAKVIKALQNKKNKIPAPPPQWHLCYDRACSKVVDPSDTCENVTRLYSVTTQAV